MKKVLIIDDNDYKTNDIKNYLKDLDVSIETETCYVDAICKLIDESFDYVILDMQFPFYKDEEIEQDQGINLLMEIKRKEINTKIIMCSSSENLEKQCSKYSSLIIGYIHYDSSVYLKNNFNELIK